MLNITLKPHRQALLADSAETQKLFAMLKLLPSGELAAARSGMVIVIVIDTSGSMREFADQEAAVRAVNIRGLAGQQATTGDGTHTAVNLPFPTKLDQAIQAAHQLVDDARLSPSDRIGVVQFDTDASALLPLTPVSNRSVIHAAIDQLRNHSGETQMGKGLECARVLLTDVSEQIAKRVIVLTDGATKGEPQCRRIAGTLAESNTPLVTIGIGEEYNEELLNELATCSRGRPYALKDMSEFQQILEAEVGSSTKEVLTDLQLKIATVKGVSIDSVTRVFPSLCEVESEPSPLRLGNIAAGDYTVFVIEMSISGLARPESRVRLAQYELSAFASGHSDRETFAPQNLFVAFTKDSSAVAVVDPEVMNYVQQKNVDRLIQQAVGQATKNVGQAKQTIQAAMGMTKRLQNAAMTRVLENALSELNSSGAISSGTRKTIVLGGKTKTMKAGDAGTLEGVPSEEEIRRLSGL